MDESVRTSLNGFLPPDAAERCNASGLSVSLTVYDAPGQPTNQIAATFKNRSDLISTLAASAYIPIWSGNGLFTDWRGRNALDGSITQRQPCPPRVRYCVRIASSSPEMRAAMLSNARGNVLGAAVRQIQRSVRGDRTSAVNVTKPALPDPWAAVADPARLAALRAAGVDIAPGLAVPDMPFTPDVWEEVRDDGLVGGGGCGRAGG
jgi:hypothetical protein